VRGRMFIVPVPLAGNSYMSSKSQYRKIVVCTNEVEV